MSQKKLDASYRMRYCKAALARRIPYAIVPPSNTWNTPRVMANRPGPLQCPLMTQSGHDALHSVKMSDFNYCSKLRMESRERTNEISREYKCKIQDMVNAFHSAKRPAGRQRPQSHTKSRRNAGPEVLRIETR